MGSPHGQCCPACASSDVQAQYAVVDHEYAVDYVASYLECGRCRSLRQHPMPDSEQLAAFYPVQYHSFGASGVLSKAKHSGRLRGLRGYITQHSTVLDYGCGSGAFIQYAAQHLPDVSFWGFEVSDSREMTESVGGRVRILRGSLDDLMRVLPPCDLVTMNHVIEHLPDPRTVLSALRDRLNPGGTIEGQTPAADSLERRLFGTAWSGYHAPRHTVVFSREGLRALLLSTRFASPKVSTGFNPAGIAVSLASMWHGRRPGVIRRAGPRWLALVAAGTLLAPVDLLSGSPGIINYAATKP